jgi:hypothetical protein
MFPYLYDICEGAHVVVPAKGIIKALQARRLGCEQSMAISSLLLMRPRAWRFREAHTQSARGFK